MRRETRLPSLPVIDDPERPLWLACQNGGRAWIVEAAAKNRDEQEQALQGVLVGVFTTAGEAHAAALAARPKGLPEGWTAPRTRAAEQVGRLRRVNPFW